MERFIAAAVQLNVTPDRERNLEQAEELIRRASDRGAQFIALPENTDLIAPHGVKVEAAEPIDGPTVSFFSDLAHELEAWILVGSIGERSDLSGRVRNTSILIAPSRSVVATYRKIHLFDVDLEDGTSIRESSQVEPGDEVVVANTPLGKFGMSVCYDLRFPELYRELSRRGAELLLIPSAFTLHTGKDHWEPLIRARAIENSCWVIAPAQTGHHLKGRTSYGHTMIVDPWGTIVAQCSDGPGVCLADVDPQILERVRTSLPSLTHRRLGIDGQ